MREIKFRFYRTKTKEMVYGFKGCSRTYVLDMWENEKHVSELMQYTGLIDKNGKEIYEADFIKINDEFAWVFFEDGCFSVMGLLGDLRTYPIRDFLFRGSTIEVVGNEYENQEFLRLN